MVWLFSSSFFVIGLNTMYVYDHEEDSLRLKLIGLHNSPEESAAQIKQYCKGMFPVVLMTQFLFIEENLKLRAQRSLG